MNTPEQVGASVVAEATWRYLRPPVTAHEAEQRRAYTPIQRGVLPPGLAAILTWVPPSPARLERVTLRSAPTGTYATSLDVGGEETIDPTQPIPWERLHPSVLRGDIGLIVLPTQRVVLRLQRPDTM